MDKSLICLNETGRYTIHELLRQYGAEQMEAAHETTAVQRAYIDYYLGMLGGLERDIKGRDQIAHRAYRQTALPPRRLGLPGDLMDRRPSWRDWRGHSRAAHDPCP